MIDLFWKNGKCRVATIELDEYLESEMEILESIRDIASSEIRNLKNELKTGMETFRETVNGNSFDANAKLYTELTEYYPTTELEIRKIDFLKSVLSEQYFDTLKP